jgi:hypothetical protein
LRAIEAWLTATVAPFCNECLIFGSAVRESQFADVDVLLIFSREMIDEVVRRSSTWRFEFNRNFGCSLHLNRLTQQEADEMQVAVGILLQPSCVRVKATLPVNCVLEDPTM